ncbi:hypothetical protein N8009_03360 [Flavobacteriaceae bacterium]|nr:hypothetical protein [Flavobacteriaceae bacterium]
MKTHISYLFILIIFINCKNEEKATIVTESKQVVNTVSEQETTGITQDKTIDVSCFDDYFNHFIESFEVAQRESDNVTREGVLNCFIVNNQKEFSELEKELFLTLSDTKDYKEPIRVKKLIYNNNQLAETIFTAYSKGFYDDCIGIKEPNFIIQEGNVVYVFFVRAEYYRQVLLKFKEELLKIKKCTNLKVTECR